MDNSSPPVDPTDSPYANLASYAQSGTIVDPSLGCLRDQIKKVLIPTLIKIFQLKLELNQAMSPPSRLYPTKTSSDCRPILDQLATLDEDLNTLIRWCESCRGHIAKAVNPHEETLKKKITPHSTNSPADALVRKSFSSALSSQSKDPKNNNFSTSHKFFSSSLKKSQKKWVKYWKAIKSRLRLP